MIQSIQVNTKPFAVKAGETYWVNHIFDTMEVVILDPTAKSEAAGLPVFRAKVISAGEQDYYIGKEIDLFPRDLGLPGYAYDNRPCGLFRSRLAADAATGRYFKWLDYRADQKSVISKYISYK